MKNKIDIYDVDTNTYYLDTKLNKIAYNIKTGEDEVQDEVAFVDGDYNSSALTNKRIYGYSNGDTISTNNSGRADIYIESGLGSDTITTGGGNDTIYTNANIDDEFDKEDENTTNTVNSGSGDDTIYGSKGIDKVNAGDGNDVIKFKNGLITCLKNENCYKNKNYYRYN